MGIPPNRTRPLEKSWVRGVGRSDFNVLPVNPGGNR